MTAIKTEGKSIKKVVGGYFETDLVDFNEKTSYDYIKEIVNGYFDVVRLPNNVDIWINDEGKINGMKPNVALLDKNGDVFDILYGDLVVLASNPEGDTLPLDSEQVTYFSSLIGHPLVLTMNNSLDGDEEDKEVIVVPTLKFDNVEF